MASALQPFLIDEAAFFFKCTPQHAARVGIDDEQEGAPT
jgi:hypothetical protein